MDTSYPTLRIGTPIVFPFERPASAGPAAPATNSAVLMRILDELDYGVMLVSPQARVRFANRMALRECAAPRCMRLVDGHLQAHDDGEQRSLLRALAASRLGRRSLLTFASQQPMQSLAVMPVDTTAPTSSEPAALIVFGRRQVCEPLSVDFFAREHRLTAAETAVLRGLANGLRPAEVASQAGVAMSTVRTQITSLRLKTGTRSIGELVRLVTVLPPIVSVVAS